MASLRNPTNLAGLYNSPVLPVLTAFGSGGEGPIPLGEEPVAVIEPLSPEVPAAILSEPPVSKLVTIQTAAGPKRVEWVTNFKMTLYTIVTMGPAYRQMLYDIFAVNDPLSLVIYLALNDLLNPEDVLTVNDCYFRFLYAQPMNILVQLAQTYRIPSLEGMDKLTLTYLVYNWSQLTMHLLATHDPILGFYISASKTQDGLRSPQNCGTSNVVDPDTMPVQVPMMPSNPFPLPPYAPFGFPLPLSPSIPPINPPISPSRAQIPPQAAPVIPPQAASPARVEPPRQYTRYDFHSGQRVKFKDHDGEELVGRIIRYNPQRASVKVSSGSKWMVPYSQLRPR